MMKQIVVHSRPVKLYSLRGGGDTWSSNPRGIVLRANEKGCAWSSEEV